MKRALGLGLMILAGLTPFVATAGPDAASGRRAAVVLTYDDGLKSQLDNALPALDMYGLKGVFFLSAIRADDVAAWRAVAAGGHELANHTPFHPCLAGEGQTPTRYNLESYTPEAILREIRLQNALLTALDGLPTHGFASPCGQTTAGGEDYLEPLRASGLAFYTRGVSDADVAPDAELRTLDRMHVPARVFAADATGRDLIAFAEEAREKGGLAVFLFHGVGGDYLTVSKQAHDELLAWLAAHRDTVWTTTFRDAFAWADAHKVAP